ncbi:MAG: hypothetical protein EZS26_000172 [Candidatus Ordinivivax streblomastigis]|uniref:Uncharacterized protein n=1 Tax=Candidatus Ordinivivax streblomastigis TaxID=2540710 RepID=A0A5M8P5C2_9BACT|nr:MAG: hypothetical protein EZS26_000172 [Candidatus Ordinivivax streblomastigis]
MNVRSSLYLLGCLFTIGLTSCVSAGKIEYLQTHTKEGQTVYLQAQVQEGLIRFQADDVLSITVNMKNGGNVVSDYNLPLMPSATTYEVGDGSIDQGLGRQTYLVSKDGYINFPTVGLIKVAGYTQQELEAYLWERVTTNGLKGNPIITVRLTNFRITVLGEVNRPGEYSINRDHITIMEAIALAGDLTLSGKRNDVKIIRSFPDGKTQIVTLDLSRADVVSSPYYYLHQGDQIYVIPNSARKRSADIGASTGLIINLVSVLLGVVNTVVILTRI